MNVRFTPLAWIFGALAGAACGTDVDLGGGTQAFDLLEDASTPADASAPLDAAAMPDAAVEPAHDSAAPVDAASGDACVGDAQSNGAVCCGSGAQPLSFLDAPIIPPYAAAGIDLYGGPNHDGSEGRNPADPAAFHYDLSADGTSPSTLSAVLGWMCDPGGRYTVVALNDAGATETGFGVRFANYPMGGFGLGYEEADDTLNTIALNYFASSDSNYRGTMEATGPDGTHYSIGLGTPILKTPNGGVAAPFVFPPEAANVPPINSTANAVVNELNVALMNQFRPDLPIPADCVASGDCGVISSPYDNGAYSITTFAFAPLHLTLGVQVVAGPDPSGPGNTPIDLTLTTGEPPTMQ